MRGAVAALEAEIHGEIRTAHRHVLHQRIAALVVGHVAPAELHTRPSGLHATREPLQIGAEIYGHAGLEADAEIQELALASLALAGFAEARLDLTHAGLLRALIPRLEQA